MCLGACFATNYWMQSQINQSMVKDLPRGRGIIKEITTEHKKLTILKIEVDVAVKIYYVDFNSTIQISCIW